MPNIAESELFALPGSGLPWDRSAVMCSPDTTTELSPYVTLAKSLSRGSVNNCRVWPTNLVGIELRAVRAPLSVLGQWMRSTPNDEPDAAADASTAAAGGGFVNEVAVGGELVMAV